MQEKKPISRIFTAAPAPPEFIAAASGFKKAFGELPVVRWVPEANMHITLFFLGDVYDANIPAVSEKLKEVASGCAPFKVTFEAFTPAGDPRHPSMIWGRYYRHPSFTALSTALTTACRPFMLHPATPFPDPIPHITLARTSRQGVFNKLPEAGMDPGAALIDRICLWKTIRQEGGVSYEELSCWPFGK